MPRAPEPRHRPAAQLRPLDGYPLRGDGGTCPTANVKRRGAATSGARDRGKHDALELILPLLRGDCETLDPLGELVETEHDIGADISVVIESTLTHMTQDMTQDMTQEVTLVDD